MKKLTVELPVKNFNRLSAAQKRVAIAEDVLKQIRSEKYQIETGIWAEIDIPNISENACTVNQNLLLTGKMTVPEINCRVCALGGALLSSIRLANVHSFQESAELENDVIPQLGKYFSARQMGLIEAAFENRSEILSDFEEGEDATLTMTEKEHAAIRELSSKVDDDTARAIAIFKNIVKNGGTFKP